MATFLFIMIVLALLALVVTLVVFTLSQRKKARAKIRTTATTAATGHNRIPYRFQPHYPPLKATAFSGGGNALFYNILIQ